jgi:transcriptional regulator with XRE-family HTH domain
MRDRPGTFADALRSAIDARGLSLDRITDHLAQRGVSVSSATLSYWRSGRSEPGRRSSLAALPHLEEVLGLPAGSLTAALPSTRERTPRHAVRGLDVLWPEEPHTAVLGRLDTSWDTELARVSVHDVLHIGPDRRQARLTVRQAMRARADGPDRRVVMHAQDDLDAGLPEIRPLRGCALGRVERDPEAGVVGAELVFFRPLRRGETVIVTYDVVSPTPGPREHEYTRRLRLPMREYLLEVAFEPRALPESVVAFTEDREQPITLDRDRRAHLVHTDTAPGTTGIRWSWPS